MSFSSDLEDISDQEMCEEFCYEVIRKQSTIMTRTNHFNLLGDNEFYVRFRLTKASAYAVLELIGPHIKNKTNW